MNTDNQLWGGQQVTTIKISQCHSNKTQEAAGKGKEDRRRMLLAACCYNNPWTGGSWPGLGGGAALRVDVSSFSSEIKRRKEVNRSRWLPSTYSLEFNSPPRSQQRWVGNVVEDEDGRMSTRLQFNDVNFKEGDARQGESTTINNRTL